MESMKRSINKLELESATITSIASGDAHLIQPLRNFHQAFPVKMGRIYKIVSPSCKAYIGQTTRPLAKRMDRHRDLKWGNCKLLKRAIKKYGWEAMKVEQIWTGPVGELNAMEVELIASHGTLAPKGYNSTVGGDVNPMSSESGRQSIKDSWADPEVRAKHIEGRKAAWADPKKRANHMAARERRREAILAKLPEGEREERRKKMKRAAQAQARLAGRKRTASSCETSEKARSEQSTFTKRPKPYAGLNSGSKLTKSRPSVNKTNAFSELFDESDSE